MYQGALGAAMAWLPLLLFELQIVMNIRD